MGCATAFVYVFAALAPFIAIQRMHLNPSEYGLWNLLPPIGIISGSQLSAYLAKHMRSIRAIFWGLAIMLLGIILMLLTFAWQIQLPIWLFFPMIIIYIGMSFVFANASTLAMQTVKDKSSASAMMNFINMGIATLSVLLIGLISVQSILLLPLTYLVLILFAFILAMILIVKLSKQIAPQI